MKEKIIILGCSGSIGTQSLDILIDNPNFELVGISLYSHFEKIETYLEKFPSLSTVAIIDTDKGQEFKEKYQSKYNVAYGNNANEILLSVCDYDSCINAIMGNDGLIPTLKVLEQDKILYLSNKESLVLAGDLVNKLLKKHKKARLYPIDSEHVGLYKLINYANKNNLKIDKYYITASGGSLRDYPYEKINEASIEDVLNHPTWRMGSKITVDSATMVNKSYEIVEGTVLFNIPFNRISAVICYESTLHAAIKVGSEILYDYGVNDMHECIKFALNKCVDLPNIISSNSEEIKEFTLKEISKDRYSLYYRILDGFKKYSFNYMICVNTIDEIAINLFLNKQIKFSDIEKLILNVSSKFTDNIYNTNDLNGILNLISKVKIATFEEVDKIVKEM